MPKVSFSIKDDIKAPAGQILIISAITIEKTFPVFGKFKKSQLLIATCFDAKVAEGNGLNNIKARAQEINAVIRLNSEKDKGTSLDLILKVT